MKVFKVLVWMGAVLSTLLNGLIFWTSLMEKGWIKSELHMLVVLAGVACCVGLLLFMGLGYGFRIFERLEDIQNREYQLYKDKIEVENLKRKLIDKMAGAFGEDVVDILKGSKNKTDKSALDYENRTDANY